MIAYAALPLYAVWPEHEIDPADRQTIRTSIELLALLTVNLKTRTVKQSVELAGKLDAAQRQRPTGLIEPVE